MIRKYTVLAVLLVFISCKNDDKDDAADSLNASNDYRLTSVVSSQTSSNDSLKVFYSSDKVVEVKYFSKSDSFQWESSEYTTIQYEGNKTVGIGFEEQEEVYRFEVVNSNGLIIEENSYDKTNGAWVQYSSTKYNYDGSRLMSWEESYDYAGSGVLTQQSYNEVIWNSNGDVSEIHDYRYIDGVKSTIPSSKEVYHYLSSKVDSIVFWGYNEVSEEYELTGKQTFEYSGDLVVESEYLYFDGKKYETESLVTYSYDTHDNLIMTSSNGSLEINYYEKGKGNLADFGYYPDDYLSPEPKLKNSKPKKVKGFTPYWKRFSRFE